ncbi:(2Fe-2S)-binding protein [Streptomyces sp. NPDC005805]|uniref:(2Fe-2S)-binding protein n=1 Tax=Streptomyces sp. NPDC005805 TaxID=3157068 RepID=UPI0033CE1F04
MNALRPAPPSSVAAALKEVADLGSFFAVELGGPVGSGGPGDPDGGSHPGDGWHPVEETYRRGAADLVAATADRYGTGELRIGASMVQLGHAARLWSPVLACTVVHGIVPDLKGLRRADEGAALCLPATPTGWYAPGLPRLAELLYEVVVHRHLDALAAGLHVKVAPRLLAGNAASALAEAGRAILAAHPDLRRPLTEVVDGLLSTDRLAGTGNFTAPDLSFRRRSCCLYYRVPAGVKCEDCSLAR